MPSFTSNSIIIYFGVTPIQYYSKNYHSIVEWKATTPAVLLYETKNIENKSRSKKKRNTKLKCMPQKLKPIYSDKNNYLFNEKSVAKQWLKSPVFDWFIETGKYDPTTWRVVANTSLNIFINLLITKWLIINIKIGKNNWKKRLIEWWVHLVPLLTYCVSHLINSWSLKLHMDCFLFVLYNF